nr:acidic mammalian chitinase-like [Leptinotarsa decemlineata]
MLRKFVISFVLCPFADGFKKIVELKKYNPQLKVLVSMGGWNEGSGNYSNVAKDPVLRKTLARNVLEFVQSKSFDGFDLDWEYPGSRNGSHPDIDKENFIALLTEISDLLKPRGLLFTAAVAGGIERINLGYDIPRLNNLLDMINVMVYDFHGHFEPFVGHGSPLHASSLDYEHGRNSTLTVATGIEYWIYMGADPEKINLGIVTYGRCFQLADPSNTQLYAPSAGPGNRGPYTNQSGFLGYNEICEFHMDWTYVWDDEQKVPHRIGDVDQWVGYEDEKSLGYKVEFAKQKNLGGFMVWALDTDDFTGLCGKPYPLVNSLHFAINAYKEKTNF